MTSNNVPAENEETAIEVELETVVEKGMNEFEHVSSITIDHLPTYERPRSIRVRVYTPEPEGVEDDSQLYSSDHKIALDKGDETLLVPVSVVATCDGPVTCDTASQTTIYMADNVRGADTLQLDDGLAYVRDKLQHPEQCDEEWGHISPLARIRNYSN